MPLYATARLLRDAHASAFFPAKKRSIWVKRLRARAADRLGQSAGRVRVRLGRTLRTGSGGCMLRAVIEAGGEAQNLRLKWCPDADPAALEATVSNMRWWRAAHPQLASGAADLVDYWPEERVLVIAECPGRRLGVVPAHALTGATRLGAWFRAYARGHASYGPDVEPRLGATASRDADGRLWVDAGPLIESRAARADQAVAVLMRHGVIVPKRVWHARDREVVLDAHRARQHAGFVHGDLKGDNVLVTAEGIAVVDWWIAPCVSWPLTDVANFAGSVWLAGTCDGAALWRAFIDAYAPEGIDENARVALAPLATTGVLDFLARRVQSARTRLLERRRVARILQRLADPHLGIAAFIANSQSQARECGHDLSSRDALKSCCCDAR